jgi:hypothetical protein
MPEEWCLKIYLDYVHIFCVYLSAYKAEAREQQLEQIYCWLLEDKDRPAVVVGDFNTAPKPADGMIVDQESNWTSVRERDILSLICKKAKMVDMTSCERIGRQEYTIQRKIRGRDVAFRCDLALCSDLIASEAEVNYDHSVRRGPLAFTDHSAIILDLPVAIKSADLFTDFGPDQQASKKIHAHKTAMSRSEPSKVADALRMSGFLAKASRILDYGCGRGRDVEFYRSLGIAADGYDPYPGFGWTALPEGEYDLISIAFVLNVIYNPYERLKALRAAVKYLAPSGCLVVATRSPWSISREAKSKGWDRFNDGFISHEGRGTFQKGIGRAELVSLVERVGLRPIDMTLDLGPDVSHVLSYRDNS